jgi:hypothetical protein
MLGSTRPQRRCDADDEADILTRLVLDISADGCAMGDDGHRFITSSRRLQTVTTLPSK